jgi:hypothetical protein
MVSAAQLTQLCWTEIGYRFGRLDGVRFAADQDGLELGTVFAYAARLGTFCPDGEPLALAAIPATGRTARACSQRELLDRAAALMGFDDAEALVRALFETPGGPRAGRQPEDRRHRRARLGAAAWRPWTPA